MQCAPDREHLMMSCYTDQELEKMVRLSGNQVGTRKENIMTLKSYYNYCPDEACWSGRKDIFRPRGTWGGNGWLSDDNIRDSLKQYEKKYTDFALLGVELVDFWNYNAPGPRLSDLKKEGKKKLALVLNLYGSKPENQYKKHWVAIFSDTKTIEYFDSSNFKIKNPMKQALARLSLGISYVFRDKKPIKIYFNTDYVQKRDGDCGIYTIDFIVSRLEGKSYKEYLKDADSIEKIKLRRKEFFNGGS